MSLAPWLMIGATIWSVVITKGDNYRDHNANETGSILGRVQYQTEKNQFFVETSYYDNRRELAGSLTLDQINENPRQANSSNSKDFNHEKTTAARAGYQHQLTEDWSLGADLNYSDTDVETVSWGSPGKNERSLLEFTPPKAVANITTDKGELNIVTGLDLSVVSQNLVRVAVMNKMLLVSMCRQISLRLRN